MKKFTETDVYKRQGLTTLILDVNLTQPGASATYDVVVENQGDLDAVLSSINGVNENNNKDPQAIKVSIENIKVGDPLLAGCLLYTSQVTILNLQLYLHLSHRQG